MKVIICLPGRQFSSRFLTSWTQTIVGLIEKGHEIVISQKYSSMVHYARAMCLGGDVFAGADQKPFQGQIEYDVMLWLDSDIIFTLENVLTLINSPHNITSGLYMMEDNKQLCAVGEWKDDHFCQTGSYQFLKPEDINRWTEEHKNEDGTVNDVYYPCAYVGMGFMAIKKGVVEKIKYPWFYRPAYTIEHPSLPNPIVDIHSEDVCFCKNLIDAGEQIYADVRVRIGHEKSVVL
jgi:hypothetical protein